MPTVLAVVVFSLALGGVPQPPQDAPNASYYFLLGRHLEGNGKIDDAVVAFRRTRKRTGSWARCSRGLPSSGRR
jgi:hypothetical protein